MQGPPLSNIQKIKEGRNYLQVLSHLLLLILKILPHWGLKLHIVE